MSAKDMAEGEIQEEEVPEIKTLHRESAEKRVAENNASGIGFENDGGSAHEKQKRQKVKNSEQ